MPKRPLIPHPQQLPTVQKLNLTRKRALKKLYSFDVMHWEDTPYGDSIAQRMNIHELNDLCPRDGWPTVLLIHGGGWVSGSADDLSHLAPRFARRGIMACTMSYHLAPTHRWPMQYQDICLALDFLRSQQVDLNRIALWGFSAGAHLALYTALHYPHPIAAVVAMAPATDLSTLKTEHWAPCFSESQLREASPLHTDQKHLPPTLLLHGEHDPIFPIDQSQRFAERFPASCTFWPLANGNHGMWYPWLKGWKLKNKAMSWLEQQLDLPSRGSKWKRRKKKNR